MEADLANSSTKLSAWISKEQKEFLNVDISKFGIYQTDPDGFLESETFKWKPYWCPQGMSDLAKEVELTFKHLRSHVLETTSTDIPNPVSIDVALKGYNNNTKGADGWTASELKGLPDCCKSSLSACMDKQKQICTPPLQSLLNLHPLLGKPNGTTRTICKTPMLSHRTMCRSITSIDGYDLANKSSFDDTGNCLLYTSPSPRD